jgi:hypothetical protein
MAFSNYQETLRLEADTSLASAQFHIVDLNATVGHCDLAAAENGFGVVQNIPNSGEQATVVVEGVTKCIGGVAITVGDYIVSAASGFATIITSGGAQGAADTPFVVLGRALTTAVSGGIFSMAMHKTLFNPASGAAAP